MGTLSVYHMDIEEFIDAKSKDQNRLKHFNLSVIVDNDFMNAVEADSTIELHHPVYDEQHKILKDKAKWIYHKEIGARYLWDKIVRSAYDTGEPGILMGDTMNRDNPLWYIENIVCTNPSMAA